jgi:hypothetical protein
VHQIVRQFLDFDPYLVPWSTSAEDERAFYRGYLRALETARTDELDSKAAWSWYRDLRECVARCAADDADMDAVSEHEQRAS